MRPRLAIAVAALVVGMTSLSAQTSATPQTQAPGASLILPPAAAAMTWGGGGLSLDTTDGPFRRLFEAARVPAGQDGVSMGAEVMPGAPLDRDPRVISRPVPPLAVGAGTFGTALAIVVDHMPAYEMFVAGGVIDFAPRSLRQSPTHFMNRRLGKFDIADLPIVEAIVQMRQRVNPAYLIPRLPNGEPTALALARPGADIAWYQRRISLTLDNPTPRDVLNAIAAQAGNVLWTVTYEPTLPFMPTLTIEETCTFTLFRKGGGASTVAFPPSKSTRPGSIQRQELPPLVRMGPAVTLDLPVTPARLTDALQQLSHNTHAQFGLEQRVSAASLSAPAEELATKAYLLTGMSAAEALDTIVKFAPEYTWTSNGPIYHVRTKELVSDADLPLNRRASAVGRRFDGVDEALAGVAEQLGGSAETTRAQDPAARFQDILARRIFVSLPTGTIRDLLDAIARTHGEMSWSVEYARVDANRTNVIVRFIGFDPWIRGIRVTLR